MINEDNRFGYLKVETLEALEEKLQALTEERDYCERFLQRKNIRSEAKTDIYNDIMYLNDIIRYIEVLVNEKKEQRTR
ncbi:MAG: hypothetical protein IKE63_04685 [Bacilli bacterium]|nr:hypothetical protein [Bacilli bacterium]